MLSTLYLLSLHVGDICFSLQTTPLEFRQARSFLKYLRLGLFRSIFFCLSGAALHSQLVKVGFTRKWIFARVVRLFPLYWICLVIPILFGWTIGEDFSYPGYAYSLDILGLQSVSPNTAITPGNPPLWSLSVGIILSFSLLLIPFIKLYAIVALSLFSNTNNPILNAIPFFYAGYLASNLKSRLTSINPYLTNLLLPISILIAPIFLIMVEPIRLRMYLQLVLITLIVCLCLSSKLVLRANFHSITIRSYSLYCVHFPIIMLSDRVYFSSSQRLSLTQTVLSLSRGFCNRNGLSVCRPKGDGGFT